MARPRKHKIPVRQVAPDLVGLRAPGGRLFFNSVLIDGVEYDLESLLKYLVDKVQDESSTTG